MSFFVHIWLKCVPTCRKQWKLTTSTTLASSLAVPLLQVFSHSFWNYFYQGNICEKMRRQTKYTYNIPYLYCPFGSIIVSVISDIRERGVGRQGGDLRNFSWGGSGFLALWGGKKSWPEGGGTRGEIFFLAAFGGQKNPDFVKKAANFLLFSHFLQNFRPPAAAGGEQ